MELYAERGFEQTTVAEIAERAGLTERTFFRHYADKREVLFSGGTILQDAVAAGVAEAAAGLRAAGVRLLAADGAGECDLDAELDRGGLAGPTAWIFGNEAWGLPEATRELADEVVRVPIHGRAESLNLATAAAVCLYASARAQRAPGGCRTAPAG